MKINPSNENEKPSTAPLSPSTQKAAKKNEKLNGVNPRLVGSTRQVATENLAKHSPDIEELEKKLLARHIRPTGQGNVDPSLENLFEETINNQPTRKD